MSFRRLLLSAFAAPLLPALLPALLAAQSLAVAPLQPVPAGARAAVTAARRSTAPDRSLLVAINPVGAIFGLYSLNVEKALDANQSLGITASITENGFDDDDYDGPDYTHAQSSAALSYRYYPRAVFRGLSLDGQLGWARVQDIRDFCVFEVFEDCTQERERASAIHFGFELGYNWLLGGDDRLHVGLAAGARRYVITGDERINGESAFARPSGRFSIGLRF